MLLKKMAPTNTNLLPQMSNLPHKLLKLILYNFMATVFNDGNQPESQRKQKRRLFNLFWIVEPNLKHNQWTHSIKLAIKMRKALFSLNGWLLGWYRLSSKETKLCLNATINILLVWRTCTGHHYVHVCTPKFKWFWVWSIFLITFIELFVQFFSTHKEPSENVSGEFRVWSIQTINWLC